jgi:hypothetical protein
VEDDAPVMASVSVAHSAWSAIAARDSLSAMPADFK